MSRNRRPRRSAPRRASRGPTHRHHPRVRHNPAEPPIVRYAPTVWHRDHRFALGAIATATVLTLVVGFLGPSAVTLTLGPRDGFLPPLYLPSGVVKPGEWLVSSICWAIIIVGALGLWIGLRALAGGWQPSARRIFGFGALLSTLTIMVPPLTSADVLMYAGYGRLQLTGRSPYDITPAEIYRGQYDPVLIWTERPWTDTPSVYGPITSWVQLAANRLGGVNMHDIVFWLQVSALVPFVLACAGIVWLARGDAVRQGRAALLTIANPLLIWGVVTGAHNEALSVMFAVGGMIMLRRSPLLAGLGIGLAGCSKLSIGLWGLAMLWAYRRDLKKAALLCLGTAVPMVLAYVIWQPRAFFQVLRNGTYVSVGSWANPVYRLLELIMGQFWGTLVVGVIAYGGLIVITWMLSKVVPWIAVPGLPRGSDPRLDPLTVALRTALVLSVGWLVTAMYTLAWYDLIAWLPLALMAASKLDRIMLGRITLLSLAFVPGRSVDIGAALQFVNARVYDTISPIVQFGVLIAIVWWWKRPDREELFPFRAAEVVGPVPERVSVS